MNDPQNVSNQVAAPRRCAAHHVDTSQFVSLVGPGAGKAAHFRPGVLILTLQYFDWITTSSEIFPRKWVSGLHVTDLDRRLCFPRLHVPGHC